MAFFRHSWQFLQLAQFDQLGELVRLLGLLVAQQLGELVRLLVLLVGVLVLLVGVLVLLVGVLVLLVGVLVADNRAHVRPAFRPSPSGQRQTTHLQQHQAIDQGLARSGAALVSCPH